MTSSYIGWHENSFTVFKLKYLGQYDSDFGNILPAYTGLTYMTSKWHHAISRLVLARAWIWRQAAGAGPIIACAVYVWSRIFFRVIRLPIIYVVYYLKMGKINDTKLRAQAIILANWRILTFRNRREVSAFKALGNEMGCSRQSQWHLDW